MRLWQKILIALIALIVGGLGGYWLISEINDQKLDAEYFLAPYAAQTEAARKSIMEAPNLVSGSDFKPGLDPSMGMISGDHTCLGDTARQFNMIDPGYCIAVPLDRMNALKGISSNITQTCNGYLNGTWVFGKNGTKYDCVYRGNLPFNPFKWNDPRLVIFGHKQAGIYDWALKGNAGNAFVCAPEYDDFSNVAETPVVTVDVIDTSKALVPNITKSGVGMDTMRFFEWILNQYLSGLGKSSETQSAITYFLNDWDGTEFKTLDPKMTCRVYARGFSVIRALRLWAESDNNLKIAKEIEARLFGLQITTGTNAGQFALSYSQLTDCGPEEMGYALIALWDQLPSVFEKFL